MLVIELGALRGGGLEDALDFLLHRDVDAGGTRGDLLVPGRERRNEPLPQLTKVDTHPLQELSGRLLALPKQPEEQMPALDALCTELTRLVTGEEHHASCFFGELLEHIPPAGRPRQSLSTVLIRVLRQA